MANTMTLSEKIPYQLVEFDASGAPAVVNPADKVTVVSGEPTLVEVVPDGTATAGSVASGFLVAKGVTTGVLITGTVTHPDGTFITTTQTVSVSQSFNAASIAINLGTAVKQ